MKTILEVGILGVVLFLGGCAGTVGPKASQGIAGQDTANSPLDTVTMTQQPAGENGDFANTFTGTARGPFRETLIDDSGIESRGTGEIRRDISWVSPDGNRLSIVSGSDVALESFEVTTPDGQHIVKLAGLSTATSEPLRAGNEALDRYKEVWIKLSAEQRLVIESANATWLESVKAVSPELFGVLKTMLGVP